VRTDDDVFVGDDLIVGFPSGGGILTVRDTGAQTRTIISASSTSGGRVELFSADGGSGVSLSGGANSGFVRVNGVFVHDYAEFFPLSDGPSIVPGMVVVIDPDNPGTLRQSDKSYDTKVAGIISGAGGFSPGMVIGDEDDSNAGNPVALSGRVYVYADATEADIQVGDLLTTSDTPGHAMRAVDVDAARGAILGKAMTDLSDGRGLILVLVTLQ
jgi:hypothetical protein